MSAKRAAPTELNHENWDQDDAPTDEDQQGPFKMAPKEVLEKRVMRTAKRRSQIASDEAKKGVFSGFSGFNKAQKTSFDFLANLTNGKNQNIMTSVSQSDPIVSTSLMSNSSKNPPGGVHSLSGTSTIITNSGFGQQISGSSLFGGIGNTPAFTQSVYSTQKPSVSDSLFKTQPQINSTTTGTSKTNDTSDKTTFQVNANLFGTSTSNTSLSSPSSNLNNNQTSPKTTTANCSAKSGEASKSTLKDDKKLEYYTNLRGLNESVSSWIKKHVEETPLCILTPIFRDYEKHLKNIQDEYDKSKEQDNPSDKEQISNADAKSPVLSQINDSGPASISSAKSVFSSNSSTLKTIATTANFTFGINTSPATITPNTGFTFGIKSNVSTSPFASNTSTANGNSSLFATNTSTTNTNSSLFSTHPPITTVASSPFSTPTSASNSNLSPLTGNKSATNANSPSFTLNTSSTNIPPSPFAINASATNTNTSPFALKTTTNTIMSPFSVNNSTTSVSSNAPFSFGVGKPFSFSSNIKKIDDPASNESNDNEEEPPKVEYTPIVEENSVYDKKCKVFVKKEGNFIDKGVGTLYIKKIDDSGKYQLLVRANTSLGNVLLNLILSSSTPTQRMGKNNVMMVCIPTPDSKPPPTSILIRVKTTEEADDLLETLNKYKA